MDIAGLFEAFIGHFGTYRGGAKLHGVYAAYSL
jgi:hypothetical protein